MQRGFDVKLASAIPEAGSLWRPNHYVVVLVAVRRNILQAADFCVRIKGDDPRQSVGMLVPPNAVLPPTRCLDLLWPNEDLDYFVARVETLADFASAA
jgi:hypothetical protein